HARAGLAFYVMQWAGTCMDSRPPLIVAGYFYIKEPESKGADPVHISSVQSDKPVHYRFQVFDECFVTFKCFIIRAVNFPNKKFAFFNIFQSDETCFQIFIA